MKPEMKNRLLLIVVLLLTVGTPVAAQSSYYMDKARSYMRDAEYYIGKAEGYDREVEYHLKKAKEYQREAEYYTRNKQDDGARSYRRKAEDETDKAQYQ